MRIDKDAELTKEEIRTARKGNQDNTLAAYTSVADAATAKALRVMRKRVRAVAFIHFHTGTFPGAPHVWNCKLCEGQWRDGAGESHASYCPLGETP